MSKEKLHIADIAVQLAENLSLNKRVAEDFVKALVTVIEESLLANDTVKLKGLGTFKLQWNDPRKSVDVNTGDEIVIDGYYKVVFTPEEELKELVNEPYAHLEPILLSENSEELKVEESEVQTPDSLKLFNEQASEIKDILSEINALSGKSEKEKKQLEDEIKKDEAVVVEELAEQGDEPVTSEEEVVRSVDQQEDRNENEIQPVISEEKNIKTKVKVEKNGKKGVSVLIMFLFGMIIGGALIYILSYNDLLPDLSLKINVGLNDEVADVMPDTIPVQIIDTISADTVSVVNAEPVDSLQLLFDEPRVYTEFIATEKVVAGSMLTRIALRHYGVKEFWVYIYEANKDKFVTPDQIAPGTVLRIPKLNPMLADKNNPRCMEYAQKLHDLYVKK